MEAAYKILKHLLGSVFGFSKILWVFSGRRGMHAWVCDDSARCLESIERKSVTNFLNVSLNSDMSDRLVVQEALDRIDSHQIFKICKEVLYPYESFLFEEQALLSHPTKGEQNFERLMVVLKRHYKEAGMEFGKEGYVKMKRDVLAVEAGGAGSLKVFRQILTRLRADSGSQLGRTVNHGQRYFIVLLYF